MKYILALRIFAIFLILKINKHFRFVVLLTLCILILPQYFLLTNRVVWDRVHCPTSPLLTQQGGGTAGGEVNEVSANDGAVVAGVPSSDASSGETVSLSQLDSDKKPPSIEKKEDSDTVQQLHRYSIHQCTCTCTCACACACTCTCWYNVL